MLCSNCEGMVIPVSPGPSYRRGIPFFPSLRRLKASATSCDLCSLVYTTLESVRTKGLKNDNIRLFPWTSNAQGDPVGMSRVFVRIGDTAGRWLDVYAEPDGAAAEHGVAAGKNVAQNSASDASFEGYEQWLSSCLNSHDTCPKNKNVNLPSRLLQVVEDDGIECLRLSATNGLRGCYAALSHCWGLNGGLITSLESLNERMNEIKPSSLSKTVADSVYITRNMGLKYLWVDTLCIIQDDDEDWKSEAAKMDQIYRLAHFTIAASSAEDGDGGCLFDRDQRSSVVVLPLSFPPSKEKTQITFRAHSKAISESFVDSPINKRAWCLQESILSTRMLHFGRDRVIWQCNERLSAEDYQDLRRHKTASVNERKIVQPHLNFSFTLENDSWFNVVEEFTRRKLTRPEDKPFAIEGIRNLFQPTFDSPYFGGIWLSNIHQGLLWYSVTGCMETPPCRRAGSWSWLALDGPVGHLHSFRSTTHKPHAVLSVREFGSPVPAASNGTLAPIGAITVSSLIQDISRSDQTLSIPEFGALSSPPLRTLLADQANLQCHAILNRHGEASGWVAFDQQSFVHESISCLLVAESSLGGTYQSAFVLIFGRSRLFPAAFRRLGVGEITRKGFWDGEGPREVVLV